MNVISHQIRDVLGPDQTLVYLQSAENQTSDSLPPWSFYLLTLWPLMVVVFVHLTCFWLGQMERCSASQGEPSADWPPRALQEEEDGPE